MSYRQLILMYKCSVWELDNPLRITASGARTSKLKSMRRSSAASSEGCGLVQYAARLRLSTQFAARSQVSQRNITQLQNDNSSVAQNSTIISSGGITNSVFCTII